MKLEEAIAKAKILNDSLKELTDEYEGQGSFIAAGMAVSFKLVLDTILTALRPVSREQVEKVWRGEWIGSGDGYADGELVYDTWTCSECGHVIDEEDDPDMLPQFCPKCYAAMTDEAVEMVMERMEAVYEQDND